MADTVNRPGAGPVKKSWVLAGVAVLAGILGVAYYRHSKNAPAAAAGTSQDPNAIDPATGLTYGEEAAGIQSGTLAGAGTPYGDTSGLIGYSAQAQIVQSAIAFFGQPPQSGSNGYPPSLKLSGVAGRTGGTTGTGGSGDSGSGSGT